MSDSTSCIPKEPLTKLDEAGSASILNYNLPQSTTYDVVSFIKLDIPPKKFKAVEKKLTRDDFWGELDKLKKDDSFGVKSIESILTGHQYSPLPELQSLSINLNATTVTAKRKTNSGLVMKSGNIPVSTGELPFSTSYIANRINDGYKPQLYTRLSGRQGLKFVPRPKQARPAVYMIMRMKMASYLGDYGAGQTLKTFSLLPGETTTISLKSYTHNEETSKSAESVLDSYSESVTEELQTTVENTTQQTESSSETDVDSMSVEAGTNVGVNLGIVSFGGDAGGGASSVNTATEAVESQVSSLESAVDHHVQTADTARQVEVNTETSSSTSSGTEETITRTLENINRSRVLNFVFRQLLQEYFTLTYLDGVSFIYDNGMGKRRRTANLSSIGNLLRQVMDSPAEAKKEENRIYEHLCNIPDYQGNRESFIELVKGTNKNCINPSASQSKYEYVKKRGDLKQVYRDKSVEGIILSVKHRILRTPSVIVDALLGQGEALDCYNIQLQEAANKQAHLENDKMEQALAIIESLSDPKDKALLYQKVFGDCCCPEELEIEELEIEEE
ncbi:hypothetical protein O4H49_03055 [Kiloniella laminariae]|uniref:Uncharacterized protein n=1 Tax=Kiloniella laminariae TaxID=454162 RepID=A0ABT4LF73_9PROT|nr:hypothetical protein [Kiloniella laminariae]MCZ4279742.1 hypothetical protein [Kiloniella laminariae]